MPGPVRQVVTYIETTANGEHIGPMVPGCGNHRSRVTTPAPWTLQLPQLLLTHIYTILLVQCNVLRNPPEVGNVCYLYSHPKIQFTLQFPISFLSETFDR